MDTVGQKGETRDQWNMIADNPLHLVASTVNGIDLSAAPPVSGPVYRGTGTMTVSAMNGIPAPSCVADGKPATPRRKSSTLMYRRSETPS
jgi:hypothetical protein